MSSLIYQRDILETQAWVSKIFPILISTTHPQIPPSLLCDFGKPTCMGVAVVFTRYVPWRCQLDNVLICQLYFAVCDLTAAIPLPDCSCVAGGGLPV